MSTKETPAQQEKVKRVMREFNQGELKGGKGNHPTVKSRKQALAIAMSEAGLSNQKKQAERPKSRGRYK